MRWLRGGWRQPQLVLLDHGLYCTMPEHLRMAYCRLWCSFVTNDMSTAVAMATELAGTANWLLVHVAPHMLQSQTGSNSKYGQDWWSHAADGHWMPGGHVCSISSPRVHVMRSG